MLGHFRLCHRTEEKIVEEGGGTEKEISNGKEEGITK